MDKEELLVAEVDTLNTFTEICGEINVLLIEAIGRCYHITGILPPERSKDERSEGKGSLGKLHGKLRIAHTSAKAIRDRLDYIANKI